MSSADRASFLTQVNREAVIRVDHASRLVSQEQLQQMPYGRPDFITALLSPPADHTAAQSTANQDSTQSQAIGLICEVKRASPSRGHMADIPDPAALASAYVAGGANCLSVLTEPAHFSGSLDDLDAVAASVSVPLLRKDFYVSPYQIWEARAHGASCILLIAAALSTNHLADLLGITWEAGLTALIETHTLEEVHAMTSLYASMAPQRALPNQRLLLGINARNLHTLDVDTQVIPSILEHASLPPNTVLVGESGVRGPGDVQAYAQAGAHAVLVGEYVSTHPNPTQAVASLRLAMPTPTTQEA